jgi:hypothetical protein
MAEFHPVPRAGGDGKVSVDTASPPVVEEHARALTAAEAASLRGALADARFWSMPPADPRPAGLDGTVWVMEGARGGLYHAVDRWEPGERGDAAYRALGALLVRLSGFPSPLAG